MPSERSPDKGKLERRVNRFLKTYLSPLHTLLRWLFIRWKILTLLPVVRTQWKNCLPLRTRNHLPILLRVLGLNGEGVEIGVLTGYFSDVLLMYSSLRCLHSVDPWREFGDTVYHDIANTAQAEHDKKYAETRERLKKYGSRSDILRMTSAEATKKIPDASLDFVFIDANHSYEACKEDIELWWPKMKSGGIFAGHDYVDGEFPSGTFGVRRAVDEFAAAHGVHALAIPDNWPSWYFQKP